MMQRAKEAGVEVMMLTVDSIAGGNRERDLRTGFAIPMRLTLGGMAQFALKPMWGINYVIHPAFALPQLDAPVDMDKGAMSIGRYYLFPLAAAGQAGVERALGTLRAEIERGMRLMGVRSIAELSRDHVRFEGLMAETAAR